MRQPLFNMPKLIADMKNAATIPALKLCGERAKAAPARLKPLLRSVYKNCLNRLRARIEQESGERGVE